MLSKHRIAALAVAGFTAACGGSSTEPGTGGTTPAAIDALPRALSTGEQKIVSSANDFSFSLFRQLSAAQKDSNVFTSPLSASMALGMTMNGAAGPTLTQMQSALGFANASESDINDGYKSLIALLRGLDASVDFRIANSIWYRTGFPVNQTFVDASRNFFDAQVTALSEGGLAYLTFNATNWNTPQTVLVTAVNDTGTDGIELSTILHRISATE